MPLVTLEYHDVVAGTEWGSSGFPGNSADSYKMSATRFAAHLAAISAQPHSRCNDVRELVAAATTGSTVLLTFDDGGASALHVAADLLEETGWRGHFLVTTGRIGTPGFLTSAELLALQRRGHVIGSHSENHPARMSLLSPTEQETEWRISRQRLEAILGTAVEVASVPGGYFDRRVAAAAAAAGVRWLFTSEPESQVAAIDGCAVIGRYTLRRSSEASLAAALVGAAPMARSRQWLVWNLKKLAKRAAGDSYLRLRATLFGEPVATDRRHETR